MKAIVSHGIENFKIEDRPVPEVEGNDVLIKVEYCGVCGTDIHQYHGTWELDVGCTPGHEISGVIQEIGSKVTRVSPGDRVAVDPSIYCGVCEYCRSERSNLCLNRLPIYSYKGGGFAEYTCVLDRQIYQLPDRMPMEWGAFLEPASCCVHGIDRIDIKLGQSVAVLGGGAIGLMLMQLAIQSGATQVIVSDPQLKRREIADQLGATATLDPNEENVVEVIRELSSGGVDAVIESAGLPVTVSQCFDIVRRGGRILLFGVNNPSTRVEFVPYQVFRHELTILGSVMIRDALPRTIELIASEKLKVQPLISHMKPLSQFLDAFGMHERNEGIKILMKPYP